MDISIVIPVFDEMESLPTLHRDIHRAMLDLTMQWQVVYVDDGSRDQSLQVLKELAAEDKKHTRIVALRRNYGQTAAIAAGIDNTEGEIIVLMDADLQNDPADIPMMLEKLDADYDVVSGWRVDRKDTFLTRTLPSRIANKLISWVTQVHLHDYGCTLKVYRRDFITGFRLYGEMHRFIPAYAGYVGAKVVEVPVHHRERKYGQTKYGLERITKVILDLFTVKFLISYGRKPIYLFGGAGMGLTGIGALMLVFIVARRLITKISVFDSGFFPVALMFMIFGFQSILMGLIAELQVRTYYEAQSKPIYTVREVINGLPDEQK